MTIRCGNHTETTTHEEVETVRACHAGAEVGTARHDERWDYAEEFGEARDLAMAGVEPRTMSGHVVTGPQDFAR